jgi:hypothetical protein
VIRGYWRGFQAVVSVVAAQDSTVSPTLSHHSTVRPDKDRGCRGTTGHLAAYRLIGGTAPYIMLEVEGCYFSRTLDKMMNDRIFKPRLFI